MAGVNAMSFLQCFDTVGWVMERAYGFFKTLCQGSVLELIEEENRGRH